MRQTEQWQRPEGLILLRGWARDGLEEAEIARRMALTPAGLRRLKGKSPAIREALSLTGELADYRVEEALLRAAVGYRYTEEKTEQTDKGEKLVTTEKEAPPNVSAITLWLKRRRPGAWAGGEEGRPAENDLLEALGNWQEEVQAGDALPGIQPQAEAGHHLVEDGET